MSQRTNLAVASRSRTKQKPTRSEILEAAAKLIVDEGYGACTMRSISERVNMKAGSLYYHFASKDEIVAEIMNLGVSTLLEEVERSVASLKDDCGFRLKFTTAVEAHVIRKSDQSAPYMQVYEHLPPVIKRESRKMRRRYAGFWLALIEQGRRQGEVKRDLDTKIFVPYFLAGLNRVPEWFNRSTMNSTSVANTIVASVLDGIQA